MAKTFSTKIAARKTVHPVTGATLFRRRRLIVCRYKTLIRTVMVSGWFPNDNGDALFWRDDALQADRALAEMKAEYANTR
jgi:hypothetical protein